MNTEVQRGDIAVRRSPSTIHGAQCVAALKPANQLRRCNNDDDDDNERQEATTTTPIVTPQQ